jgi:hypothetical protein
MTLPSVKQTFITSSQSRECNPAAILDPPVQSGEDLGGFIDAAVRQELRTTPSGLDPLLLCWGRLLTRKQVAAGRLLARDSIGSSPPLSFRWLSVKETYC